MHIYLNYAFVFETVSRPEWSWLSYVFYGYLNLSLNVVSAFPTYWILHNMNSIKWTMHTLLQLRLKKILNVCFAWRLVNVSIVIFWFQHRVLAPNKHGVLFPVLEGKLIFLVLPFSTRVPPIISFRFLFLLKAVLGCCWNNSSRFLLVWRMFQFLRTNCPKVR